MISHSLKYCASNASVNNINIYVGYLFVIKQKKIITVVRHILLNKNAAKNTFEEIKKLIKVNQKLLN